MFPEIERLLKRFLAQPGVQAAVDLWEAPIDREIEIAPIVRDALLLTRLSHARDEDVAFYSQVAEAGHLIGLNIRKRFTRLSQNEKADLGISYRGILSRDFLATLNERGMADPEKAANVIATVINSRLNSARAIAQNEARGLCVKLGASNGAAGPCFYAQRHDGSILSPSRAPLLPVDGCDHPEQCFCIFQGVPLSEGFGFDDDQ